MERLTAAGTEGLPRVLPAAETAFFSGISGCPGLERLCIQGTRTLLLEMPFMEWSDYQLEEVAALVLDRGYQVVLVHPERFCAAGSNREKLRQLGELPLAMQVNARTLLRWSTRRLGLELLREASCPLLTIDGENTVEDGYWTRTACRRRSSSCSIKKSKSESGEWILWKTDPSVSRQPHRSDGVRKRKIPSIWWSCSMCCGAMSGRSCSAWCWVRR